MTKNHLELSRVEATEARKQKQSRLILQGKSASGQRLAEVHPASPSFKAQALIGEGRLRSLEERKAAPAWHRPKV